MRISLFFLTITLAALVARAEEPETVPATQPEHHDKKAATTQKKDEPVVTQHELKLSDTALKYKASAGFITLKNAEEKPRANVFFIAYEKTLDEESQRMNRPITFVFNGGPGAASVWLHLGTAGPMRVQLPENGFPPPPPYRLDPNQETWLDFTDMVFIDPVGTGFSRAEPGHEKEFYNVEGDISSVAEVIRLYLTKYNRWPSPKFVAGESYGTTRAAGLSAHLHDRYGIDLNGIVLISTV